MGSPLGPFLADVFMSTLEKQILPRLNPTDFYRRYVDDTFVVCESEKRANELLSALNGLHERITFTMEPEHKDSLHFLDVLLKRNIDGSILRSVFHKQKSSLQYTHFRSFVPIRYKQNLVRTLFCRAYQICSDESLQDEIQVLTETLERCGYPLRFIRKYSEVRPRKAAEATVKKKPIFIALPFKGDDVTERLTRRLRCSIQRAYNAANLIVLSTTTRLPVPPTKDKLPLLAKSSLVYHYKCLCGYTYIGRTQRHLSDRVAEHLPKWLFSSANKQPRTAITKHLVDTMHTNGSPDSFSVISIQRNARLLRFAEAVAIRRMKPELCVQKDMVQSLALPW
jgi:hypothetical protein